MPGMIGIQGASSANFWAAPNRSRPQDGAGGGSPRPRKLRDASVMIAPPRLAVAMTTWGATQFGATCRKMILRWLAPAARADWTYSLSFMARTVERTTRAVLGMMTMPIAMIRFVVVRPRTAMMTMAMIKDGNDQRMSMTRSTRRSQTPPA